MISPKFILRVPFQRFQRINLTHSNSLKYILNLSSVRGSITIGNFTSPKAKQVNPVSKSKLFVSLGTNLPLVTPNQIKTRPSTAKASSNKLTDEYGIPRNVNGRTPSHQVYTGLSKEESKNLRSEAINELEKLGIEDVEYQLHELF
jgi:hypothetical protein